MLKKKSNPDEKMAQLTENLRCPQDQAAVGAQTSSPEPSSNCSVQEKQICALKRQRGCRKVDYEVTDACDEDEMRL